MSNEHEHDKGKAVEGNAAKEEQQPKSGADMAHGG
jgi:hypothetical protein